MRNRVLVVEDSLSFSSIVKEVIQQHHGFDVDVAADFLETRQLLEEHADDYFVATVDLNLPDAPNGEAVDFVIKHQIPTVVFTGSTDQSLQEDLWHKGISDYASKNDNYNLKYIAWIVKRIYANQSVEVLVVDDSLVARKHMQSLLQTQAFTVHLANSGQNALKTLETNRDIRLVIVDCFMDEMDGFELASKIREQYPQDPIEIIGISAQGSKALSAQFIKSGADDFIHKPFMPEEFLCRVNHAIDRIENFISLDELNQVKNQFIGMAAHDIRGPLGSIRTASDFLLKKNLPPERVEKLVKMINSSSQDLLNLVETLLDVTVIESGSIKLCLSEMDLARVLMDRIDLYHQEAKNKNIDINTDITDEVLIFGDEVKIKQVVDNLLTNAIKYSKIGGEIKVCLSHSESRIKLSVQDNGPGIPETEQEQLFQAFRVLSTETTGGEKSTGLGLAITKNIVDAHQGKLYYVHDDATHSTFYVELDKQAFT